MEFAKSQGLLISIVLAIVGIFCALVYQTEILPKDPTLPTMGTEPELLMTVFISAISPIVLLAIVVFMYQLIRAPAELAQLAENRFTESERRAEQFEGELKALKAQAFDAHTAAIHAQTEADRALVHEMRVKSMERRMDQDREMHRWAPKKSDDPKK
jgi:hypothetical protein